jgi:hypothetical protein
LQLHALRSAHRSQSSGPQKFLGQLAIGKAADAGNAAESVLPPKKPPAPSVKRRGLPPRRKEKLLK